MKTPIASLSIAARATLDMHSLNNEGGEGNQIQTRMVDIVDHRGEIANCQRHLWRYAQTCADGAFLSARHAQITVALCESCQRFQREPHQC